VARIRSLKPEAFQSESLSRVSLEAERTMFGLSTQVDDRGRISDKPAQLNGFIWAMRGNHSADQFESELKELEAEDMVCRYTGCDGRRYLHLVKWDEHQSINRPSPSRLPRCPEHLLSATGVAEQCHRHDGPCPAQSQDMSTHAHLSEPSTLDLGSRILDLGSGSRRESAPQAAPPAPKPPGPPARGTRIPPGFTVTGEMAEWARNETPFVDTRLEFAKFTDYWRAATGARATKRDWQATWRNWLRRAAEQHPPRAGPRGQQAETDAQFSRAMQRANARGESSDASRNGHADQVHPRALPAPENG
jgi:hypothetical protein